MKHYAFSARGFSLVEIVLAIGVIGSALVAVLGLLSVGLSSSRSSQDESLIAAMSRQVVGSLRQQQFANNPLFSNVQNTEATIQTAYFDGNGTRLFAANGINDIVPTDPLMQNAIYQCTVMAQDVTASLNSPVPSATPHCFLDIKLVFIWPVGATKTNTLSLRTSLAKYY